MRQQQQAGGATQPQHERGLELTDFVRQLVQSRGHREGELPRRAALNFPPDTKAVGRQDLAVDAHAGPGFSARRQPAHKRQVQPDRRRRAPQYLAIRGADLGVASGAGYFEPAVGQVLGQFELAASQFGSRQQGEDVGFQARAQGAFGTVAIGPVQGHRRATQKHRQHQQRGQQQPTADGPHSGAAQRQPVAAPAQGLNRVQALVGVDLQSQATHEDLKHVAVAAGVVGVQVFGQFGL